MMRKALSLMLLTALVAGCGPATVAPMAAMAPVTAQSAGQAGYLKVPTAAPTTKQRSVSKLKGLQDSGTPKPTAPLQVQLKPMGTIAGPLTGADIRSIANMTLSSMNQARSWEDGCRIAYAALDRLNQDANHRNLVIRTGYAGAKAVTRWDSAYGILALTLKHLAWGTPTDGRELFNLTLNMLDQTKTWEDGAKAGYEILFTLQTAHHDSRVRTLAGLAYDQAKSLRTWEDAHNTIRRALQEMSYRADRF